MNLEEIIEKSFDVWRKNAPFFGIAGILALVAELVFFLLAILADNPYISPILVILGLLCHWGIIFSAAKVAMGRRASIGDVLRLTLERFIDFGIAFLLLFLSLFLPVILMVSAQYSGLKLIGLLTFSFLLIFATLPTIFLLAPAYALDHQWSEALKRSFRANKKHFLSILLLGDFFLFLFLFLTTLLTIDWLNIVVILLDAIFLYPFAAISIINLAKAIR